MAGPEGLPIRTYGWRDFVRFRSAQITGLVLLAIFVLALEALFGPRARQFVGNGLVVGSYFVLGAIGLSLIYGIRNFANFAHGELMTLGAYVAFSLNNWLPGLRVDILLAGFVAFVVVSLVGVLLEYTIFHRLEGRGVISMLIASIGLFFVVQNLVRLVWGTSNRLYEVPAQSSIHIGLGVFMTPTEVWTIGIAVALVTILHGLLRYTKLGKAMRATSDNFQLAKVTGINTRLVIFTTWILAGGFAAIAGVLLGLNTQLAPIMGFQVLLFLFAAVILGGIGSPYGALLGGFIIGLSSELGKFFLFEAKIDAAYSPAAVFGILVAMLLIRPEGLMGGEPLSESIVANWRRLWRFLAKIRSPRPEAGGGGGES